MRHSNDYPAQLGFRMPAEWEPHEATWLAWPHEQSDWPGKFETISWVYGEIVRHLSRQEKVRILITDAEEEQQARRVLKKSGAHTEAVEFFRIPTDRSWTRDFCPMFVRNEAGERAVLNWRFNGWAKYDNSDCDDAVTDALATQLAFPSWTPMWNDTRIVLEGGAIDVNGSGCVLTTEECLLSPIQARNPGLGRDDIEQLFARYLGAPHTLWLKSGIAGDDTHGHIDDVARFTDPRTIAIAMTEDRSDENFESLYENLCRVRELRDQNGQPLRIETLPMPEPLYFDGQRLPASYANFYIANQTVLVPTFNDANDRIALNKLSALFPDRKVIGIGSVDLVLGLGTLHCMTQQQSA